MAARILDELSEAPMGIGEPDESSERSAREQNGHDTNMRAPAERSQDASGSGVDPALYRTIEGEIIPRLLVAHRRVASHPKAPSPEVSASQVEIEDLVALSIAGSLPDLRAFVDTLHNRGITVETLLADILPAAARHVGWMWETDACTFVDVTFSLSRLQQLLRAYAPALESDVARAGDGRRVLLSAMPGEQHTFGLSVVEEIMRRAAWDVTPQTPRTKRELLDRVREERFDIVGLSAGADGTIAGLGALVQSVRDASVNRSVRIIVGGPAVVRCPELAASSGADAVARDSRDGMAQMEWMMQSLRHPC